MAENSGEAGISYLSLLDGSPTSSFYDLQVNEAQLEPQTMRQRVAIALKLGFDGVAICHQAGAVLTDRDKCSIAPLPLEALLTAISGINDALQAAHKRQNTNAYKFQQFTRLNIPTDDANTAQKSCSNAAVVNSYDVLAVQPQTERAFAQACNSLEVDIISLDLSKRLPYRFKPALVQAAIARGIHFEIVFSPALRDAASRRQLFANAQALCREARGKHMIISSGARSAADLRGPYDISNLGTFFGLTQQQAKQAVSGNPARVIQHSLTRRAYRGFLNIQVKERPDAGQSAEPQKAKEKVTGAKRPADTT